MRRMVGGVVLAVFFGATGVGIAQDAPSCSWAAGDAAPPESMLNEIDLAGPSEAWAVGFRRSDRGQRTLVRHWDGTSWETQPSPSAKSTWNELFDVAAAEDGTAWAVGEKGSRPTRTLALRYDGEQWTMERSLNPGPVRNTFEGVDVAPDGTVYAVGWHTDFDRAKAMVQRRTRGRWRTMSLPRGTFLYDVAAVGRADVWAVGRRHTKAGELRALLVHFDGEAWSEVPVPGLRRAHSQLLTISAAGPADVWATGSRGAFSDARPVMLHFDGSVWEHLELPPLEDDAWLEDLSAADSDTAVAVGRGYSEEADAETRLFLEWDGTSWSAIAEEEPATTALRGVAVAPDGSGWAAGLRFVQGDEPVTSYVERRTCT